MILLVPNVILKDTSQYLMAMLFLYSTTHKAESYQLYSSSCNPHFLWPNSICKEDTVGPELNSQLSYSTDCVIIWPSCHTKHGYKKEWTLATNGERFSQCTKMPVPNNQLKFSQSSEIPQQYWAPGWRGWKISLKWFSLRIALSVMFLKRTILTFFHESI